MSVRWSILACVSAILAILERLMYEIEENS